MKIYNKFKIIVLSVCCLFSPICISVGSCETLQVGSNGVYESIQSAINDAQPYDTIMVSCGVYNESVILLKPLSLIGENGCTVLSHEYHDDILTIAADNCTVTGFLIKHNQNDSYAGLSILSDGNNIYNNSFENNAGWGLHLYHAQNNIIKDNDFSGDGICIVGSKDDWLSLIVQGNMVDDNPVIFYKNQDNFSVPSDEYGQVILVNCSHGVIENISVNNTDQGIVIGYSDSIEIKNTTIQNCRYGMRLQYTHQSHLIDNTLMQNQYGMYITHSNQNVIQHNMLDTNTLYGCFFCCNSQYNILSRNIFMNNGLVGYDYFDNNWSYKGIGNFYDDYTGTDENNDGIGEIPYSIPPNFSEKVDPYPIVDINKIMNPSISDTPDITFIFIFICILTLSVVMKKEKKKDKS